MRPITRTRILPNGVVGAVSASQTPGGAGNLLINGTLAVGGTVTFAAQQQVGITSAGNDSTVNFTVTGTDANGAAVSETLAGPNAATVKTVNSYLTITQISISGAAPAALTVDTVQSGADQPVPLDQYITTFNVQVTVEVTGVSNYTVQQTQDDIFNTAPAALNWTSVTGLQTQTTNQSVQLTSFARALRLVNNSGAGTAKMIVSQTGLT